MINLDKLGEMSITIDCDVLQADGGTRTASITGAFVALSDAALHLVNTGVLADNPVEDYIAAVSVGIVDGKLALDLDYVEDSSAEVDMNVAMTGSGFSSRFRERRRESPSAREGSPSSSRSPKKE